MTHRALLIGFGSIGAKRASILRNFGWDLTIWEPDAYRRVTARADGFTDVEPGGDARREVGADVAFVCTPPIYHADHAIACLQVAHVFVEKPIAHTLADARRICEAAAASDRQVMVGCNYRFWNGHRFKPEMVHSLGITLRYHLPTARPNWRESYVNDQAQGGVVLDSGVHAVDLAQWLAGPINRVDLVTACNNHLGAQVEGSAVFNLCHANGVLARICLDWSRRGANRLVMFEMKTGHRWHSKLWDGTDGMFERETREFLRCVEIGQAPPNGPEEATETLRWCLAARDMVRG